MVPAPIDREFLEEIEMANFNVSLFKSSFGALAAKSDERSVAIATFLADNISEAARSFLLDGSDALNQVLHIIETGGKAGFAVKARKVVKGIDGSMFATWGTLQAFSFVKAKDFIGGNSPRVKDHAEREAACDAYRDAVFEAAVKVFARSPAEAVVDPLASFGVFSEKTIAAKLSKASPEQMKAALARMSDLSELILTALDGIEVDGPEMEAAMAAAAAEAAAAEAAAAEAAAAEAAAAEAAAAEAAAVEGKAIKAKRSRRAA